MKQLIFAPPLSSHIMDANTYSISYEFLFENGAVKHFVVALNPQTVLLQSKARTGPEWTRLENEQCNCCPLEKNTSPYCPIALNMAELVEEFKSSPSFDDCSIRCITPERTYSKHSSIQEGLFSIFGIIMATSGCPIMDFFRPMARFHLPFATVIETVFRSTSIYLLRQYFERKRGKMPDLELIHLDKQYAEVQKINHGILARIHRVVDQDADKNAITILNSLAQMLTIEIEDNLNSLEYLFTPNG